MLDRTLSILVALSLAFLVWLYARSRDQETLDNVPVPVVITLSPGQAGQYELEVDGPPHVTVSFTGPPGRVRELRELLQSDQVRVEYTLTVPEDRLEEASYSDTVRIEPADIHVPPGVKAMIAAERNRIPVRLHRLVERRLPVRFEHVGDERITQVVVEPAEVLVRGPKDLLDRLRAVPTQPYPLRAVPETAASAQVVALGPVPLVQEVEGRLIRTTPTRVRARATVPPRRKVYELAEVPVHFLCPAGFAFKPQFLGDGRSGKLSLRVVGPAQEEPPAVLAYIDLTKVKPSAGLNHEPLRLQLPRDFQLDQAPPGVIGFELLPPEAAAKGLGLPNGP